MKYNDYVEELGFSGEELQILSIVDRFCEREFSDELSLLREKYDAGDEVFSEYLMEFADKADFPTTTLNLYLYLRLLEDTYKKYEERGIGRDIFIGTMRGFSSVCRLPLARGEGFGLAQPGHRVWMRLLVDGELYKLGRLQFQMSVAQKDIETLAVSIKEGERCLNVHIPRYEPFEDDLCEESFARAREFFKKFYGMEKPVFLCSSWLLYPWLSEVLPQDSNLVKFQKRFEIIDVAETDAGDKWIFGNGSSFEREFSSVSEYPENTTLRRAAKKRLLEGGKLGAALGARL